MALHSSLTPVLICMLCLVASGSLIGSLCSNVGLYMCSLTASTMCVCRPMYESIRNRNAPLLQLKTAPRMHARSDDGK